MSQYNNAQMRKWIAGFFENEEDFDFFCEDQFPDVFEQFTDGDSLNKKARALTKYCEENNQYDALIEKLKDEDPDRFDEFSPPEAVEDAPASEASALAQIATPDESTMAAAPSTNGNEPSAKPEGSPQIFISYSTKNLDFVQALYTYLTGKGLTVWFDKESIDGATQWRESIVEGIMECQVFLLVLSPTAAASVNVRKEIDLAEHHKKKIFPVMWQEVNPMPPSIQYQLAGTQYIDFKGVQSEENFQKITNVLGQLLDGVVMSDAAAGELTIEAEGVSSQSQPAQQTSGRGRGRGSGRGVAMSPIAVLTIVMNKVVTQLGDKFTEPEQDEINTELKWLFNAADHFYKVRRSQAQLNDPVAVSIPQTAVFEGNANNKIQNLDEFRMQLIDNQVESIVKQINIYSRNLSIELDKVAQLGGQGAETIPVALTNSINRQQKSIAERAKELADLMQEVYGVYVRGPEDLVNQF